MQNTYTQISTRKKYHGMYFLINAIIHQYNYYSINGKAKTKAEQTQRM